jgi:hypothetical protein
MEADMTSDSIDGTICASPHAAVRACAVNAPAPDLLGHAVALTRKHIADRSLSRCERIETLCSAAYAARTLGAADVVAAAFIDFTRETGLIAALGRHGAQDAGHAPGVVSITPHNVAERQP